MHLVSMDVVAADVVLEKAAAEKPVQLPVEERTLQYPEGGLKAWMTVLGGFIGLLCAFGLINTMGAIESYVASHVLQGTNEVALSMVFSIFIFLIMAVMMVSGVLFDRYGYKELCISGTLLTCGGVFATGSCTQLYQFFLAFSVCAGIGVGLLTTPLITAAGHYFNERRGLAMSLLMPGASLGGVVWPLLCRSLFVKVGFPWTMRVLGFIFMGMLSTAYLLLSDRHEEILALKESNEEKTSTSFASQLSSFVDVSVFKDVTFLWICVTICMLEFSLIIVTTYIPSYALAKGFSQSQSLLALTITNASGTVGRLVPAVLSDHYGPFNMGTLMAATMLVSIFIIWLPFGAQWGGLLAFCVVFGFAMAGTLSITPLCTAAVSEPKDFGRRYGTAYFFVSFINLIALPVGMGLTKTKMGYNAMVIFAGCTSAISTLAFVVSRYRVSGGLKLKVKV